MLRVALAHHVGWFEPGSALVGTMSVHVLHMTPSRRWSMTRTSTTYGTPQYCLSPSSMLHAVSQLLHCSGCHRWPLYSRYTRRFRAILARLYRDYPQVCFCTHSKVVLHNCPSSQLHQYAAPHARLCCISHFVS